MLSAVPQSLLAITFINSAMGTWFSSSIGEALRGASRMAIDYQDERVQNLRSFADGALAPSLVRQFARDPDTAWQSIQEVNSGIGALQLFNPDGHEIAYRGDPTRPDHGLLHGGGHGRDPAS